MATKENMVGETLKAIVLCFTTAKHLTYDNIQAIVLGEVSREAREEVSFDQRLQSLRENGYIEDFVLKQRDRDGRIVPYRGYKLTKQGRSFLLRLQKEKNELERLRKLGKPLPENKRGGDRWTKIKGKQNE